MASPKLGGEYGDPFGTHWILFGSVVAELQTQFAVPSGLTSKPFTDAPGMGHFEALNDGFTPSQGSLEPEIDAVQGLSIDAQDATFQPNGSMVLPSLTPLLAWTAPAQGATYYHVTISHVAINAAGAAAVVSTSDIYTEQTQVQVFPGVFSLGNLTYVIRIGAWYEPGYDAGAPNYSSFPQAYAETNAILLSSPP
jgi:hypothetical protein